MRPFDCQNSKMLNDLNFFNLIHIHGRIFFLYLEVLDFSLLGDVSIQLALHPIFIIPESKIFEERNN